MNDRQRLEESNLPIELAVEIADRLDALAKAKSQRDDFKRQLTAEREGRMAAERIVDEVRARNRELEAALRMLAIACYQYDGSKPESIKNYREALYDAYRIAVPELAHSR